MVLRPDRTQPNKIVSYELSADRFALFGLYRWSVFRTWSLTLLRGEKSCSSGFGKKI